MAIDINTEALYTLTEATKLLPVLNGKKVSTNAIWRWCLKGIQGVHLDHVRVGVRICTSKEALNRFANAVAEAAKDRIAIPPDAYRPVETPSVWRPRRRRRRLTAYEAERARQIREAEEELRRAGI